MSVESDLTAYLNNHAGLTALIGQRVYPLQKPQEAPLPCVSFFVVDEPHEYAHDALVMVTPRVQFDCWANTYLNVIALANTLRTALLAWKGAGGYVVQVTNGYDMPEPETELWRRVIDGVIQQTNP